MAPRARIQAQSPDSHEEFIDLDHGLSSDLNSDGDDAHVTRPPRSHSSNPTRSQATTGTVEKALRNAQLEITELKEELRAQKLKYTELEQSYKTLKSKAHKEKTKGKNSTIHDNDELIALYARRFGVMNEMFVPKDVFLQPRPQNIYSDDPDRWEDDEKMKDCVIAELYEETPDSLHDMLEKTASFRDTFTNALSNQRRSIIHQLRSKTAGRIFNQNLNHYLLKADRSVVFRDMIKVPGQEKFSKYAPILFPGMRVDTKRSRMFQNESLPLMLRSILFGSSSLSATKPSTATVGHFWGVKHVTPGAIAFVSVLAIFLHSVDEIFEATGSKSLIPYQKLFSTYKQIIMTKLIAQEKDSEFKEMITWYNSQIFDWFNPNNKGDDSDSSGIEEVMNRMGDLDIYNSEIELQGDSEDRSTAQIHSAGTQEPIPRPSSSKALAQPTAGPSNDSEHGSQTQLHIVSNPIQIADTSDLEDGDAGSAPSQPRPTQGRGRGPSKPAKAPGQTRRSSRKK